MILDYGSNNFITIQTVPIELGNNDNIVSVDLKKIQ